MIAKDVRNILRSISHRNQNFITLLALAILMMATFIPATTLAQIQFEDVTEMAGTTHEGPSFGASWGDFNADGLPDLYVGNHARTPSLYINNGDGTFTDIIASMPHVDFRGDHHGAAWADFDNDGDQDMLQLAGANFGVGTGPNKFFINTDGTFQEMAVDYGLDYPLGRGRTPLWLDWNKDGKLDAFLANTARPDGQAPSALFTQNSNSFHNDNELAGLTFGANDYAQTADLFGDGREALIVHGQWNYPNRIYAYDTIPFTDIRDSIASTTNVNDTIITDLNGDLQPDFYLTRQRIWTSEYVQTEPSTIKASMTVNQNEKGIRFHTTGDVNFQPGPRVVLDPSEIFVGAGGINPESLSFTLSPTDPEAAGLPDHVPGADCCVFIGYDPEEQIWRLLVSKEGWMQANVIIESNDPISEVMPIGFDSSDGALSDRLLIQRDDNFEDLTISAGLDNPSPSTSVVAGDFDNDMDMDLYLVCQSNITNQPNLLYENNGDGAFTTVSQAGGAAGSDAGRGESVVTADYDGDGFLDLFVTNGRGGDPFHVGPHQLFRNIGNDNHWIEIDLEGVVSNRDGIGSRLLATAGGVTQLRQQSGGMHSFSQNHQRVHFGLGSNTKVDKLNIRWPSGIVQEIHDIPADQVIRVIEPVAPGLRGKPTYQPGADEGVYIWKDRFDGPYHLRVSGSGPRVEYKIKLISDEPLADIVAYGLGSNDNLETSEHSFSLLSRVFTWEDGVDFKLQPGARALIAIEREGVPNPRQVYGGLNGQPLTPGGWILSSMDLPQRPDFVSGEDLGLYFGHGVNMNTIEARWNGDGFPHLARFHLFSSVPLLNVTTIGLEPNDILTHTSHAIDVDARMSNWWDGVDVEISDIADIGIAYEQDALFQPHRVNTPTNSLGMPNAYWIPVATDGEPDFDPAAEASVFLWKDEEGMWHLRATAGGDYANYIGTIEADQEAVSVTEFKLEENDQVDVTDLTHITFDLRMSNGWQDGIDFKFPAGTNFFLNLETPSNALDAIRIGEEKWPVDQLPVQLSGTY